MRRRGRLRCLSCALALCTAAAAGTQAAELPVTPPAPPKHVTGSFFFNKIENVDSAKETFKADLYLLLAWDDQRLMSPAWKPKVEAVNSRDSSSRRWRSDS